MDRRSWLWRRKSSEKTPGESESLGSISSPSERFSDDQAYSGHSKQSPDVTSRAATNEESSGKVKALTEKLSAALSNISAKEEIVKQHAKVAEEAVTGWEKAEREVSGLKLQLDAAIKKNSALEDRVGHLDGALKECVRQLRHAREEQERKSDSKLEAARSEAEKENKSLRRKLEAVILERDFSTKAAESASKQHLESIKKAAKLEAECRRLRSCVRKASARVDCVSDSRSDCTTLEAELNERELSQSSLRACSSEIVMMDDFLEMERLAALPENGNRSIQQLKDTEEKSVEIESRLNECQAQLNAAEKELIELQTRLIEREDQLNTSEGQLRDAEAELKELQDQLSECQGKLTASERQAKGANDMIVDLQAQLALASKLKQDAEADLDRAELRVKALESEIKSLVDEADKERVLFTEAMAKRNLERPVSCKAEKKAAQENGIALAAGKLADCQKTIESLGKQLESLATLDDFLVDSSYSPLELSKEPSVFKTTELGKLPCIDCQ